MLFRAPAPAPARVALALRVREQAQQPSASASALRARELDALWDGLFRAAEQADFVNAKAQFGKAQNG